MPRRPLDADTMLGIHLSTICSRNCYTSDPQPVIDELRQVAGDRRDILAVEAGRWAGFNEHDRDVQPLVRAIHEQIPDIEPWVALGRHRASRPAHGAGGIHAPRT